MISFKASEKKFAQILTLLGSACLTGIVLVIISNIALRFVFNEPITWSIEGCSILVVWMTFIVMGINHRENLHFRIDAITLLFPPSVQRIITMAADLLTAICLGFLLYSTISASMVNGSMPMMMIEIPMFFAFYLPMLIGVVTYLAYILLAITKTKDCGMGAP